MKVSFRHYLSEMTFVDPNVSSKLLYNYLDQVEPELLRGNHIGDVEEFKIKRIKHQTYEVFGLCTETQVVCCFKCRFKQFPKIGNALNAIVMVTKPEWKGKSLSAKMIQFFTTREVWNVLIDDLLSPANKSNLEKIANAEGSSACWYNVKTGECASFSEVNGKYKQHFHEKDTNWQILFQKRYVTENEDIFKKEEVYSRFWHKDSIFDLRMMSGYEYLENGSD